jgi:hypothetical protein
MLKRRNMATAAAPKWTPFSRYKNEYLSDRSVYYANSAYLLAELKSIADHLMRFDPRVAHHVW